MRKTSLTRKTPLKSGKTPLRRTKLNKVSKIPIAKQKQKLWALCKEIVRKRDGNVCVICGKKDLHGSSWHTGHFLPSSTCGAYLRYDLRNLHSSCYNCNINLGGNGAMFSRVLVEKFGQEFVDKIFEDKSRITKADAKFYEEKIKEYEKIRSWDKDKLLNYTKIY